LNADEKMDVARHRLQHRDARGVVHGAGRGTAPDGGPDDGSAAARSDGDERPDMSSEDGEAELEDQGGPLVGFLYQVGDAGAIDAAALYERRPSS
jgi:hypothetical protein